MQKAYSIFLGQCTIRIKGRIESRPEWPSIKDTMDVIGLLILICLIVYSFEGNNNQYHAIIELKKKQLNICQGDRTCDEYRVAFWTAVEVLESCGGKVAIDIGALNQEIDRLYSGADITTAEALTVNRSQATVREEYIAVQFFIAADLQRYGKLIEDTENAFTAGNINFYPQTVNKAYEIMVNNKNDPRNHRFAATELESISFVTQVKVDNKSENEDVT